VISRHRKDLLAANLLAVLQRFRLAPDAEIPKEIEDGIGLSGVVETVEDRSTHFLDALKRSITAADYVAMIEVKICRKPNDGAYKSEKSHLRLRRRTPPNCLARR